MTDKIIKGYYKAAAGAFFNDRTAATYGAEIERIMEKNPGVSLIPDMVLDAAADPKSPLHDYFEWDDSVCARRYRIEQAGEIISRIRYVIVTDEGEVSQRAFINVTVDEQAEEEEYVPVRRLLNSPELRARALRKAMSDLEKWCLKYGHLRELGVVVKAFKALEPGSQKKQENA